MADTYTRQKFTIRQHSKGVPAVFIDGFSKTIFVNNPDKIKRISPNEVHAYYGAYKQVITAEGSGDERYNFASVIEKA